MEFNDKLFDVLRNFMEYGNYSGKAEKAVAAIRKSDPNASKEEITILFENCMNAYKDAIILVQQNISYYSSNPRDPLEEEIQYRKKYQTIIPDQVLSWILGWIYHWYHER